MTEYSKPIRLEIDTTMMEDTEIRIIESHVEAICRVVSGAQPQGQPEPDPVPEWRRMVDDAKFDLAGSAFLAAPLPSVLKSLANIASGVCEAEGNLIGIIAVCEQQVGDGWQARSENSPFQRSAWGLMRALAEDTWEQSTPAVEDWEVLGNAAAAWLRDLAEGGTE